MGFFDFFKRKKWVDTFPENELEKAFLEACTDKDAIEQFYVKLLWSDLYVITDGNEESTTQVENSFVKLVTFDDGYIPVFTSLNRIFDHHIVKEHLPCISSKGKDLFKNTAGANFILNPYSNYNKIITAEEIVALLDGSLLEKPNYAGEDCGFNSRQLAEFNDAYTLGLEHTDGLIHEDGFRKRGISRVAKEKLAAAIEAFEECLALYPEHVGALFLLGKVHQRLRNHEKSLALFEKSFEYEKENPRIFYEITMQAMHVGATEKVIFYAEESVRLHPENDFLYYNLSVHLFLLGKDQDALLAIEKALVLNPKNEQLIIIKNSINDVISKKVKRPTFEDLIR